MKLRTTSGIRSGAALVWFFAVGLGVLVLNVAALAVAVWLTVKILQWTGVL